MQRYGSRLWASRFAANRPGTHAQQHQLGQPGGDEDIARARDLRSQRKRHRDVVTKNSPGRSLARDRVAGIGAGRDLVRRDTGPSGRVHRDRHRAVDRDDERVEEQAERQQRQPGEADVAYAEGERGQRGDGQAYRIEEMLVRGPRQAHAQELAKHGEDDQPAAAVRKVRQRCEAASQGESDARSADQEKYGKSHPASVPPCSSH
jgi:hypothetical protein